MTFQRLLIFSVLIFTVPNISGSKTETSLEKSLFDDLPLNGAYVENSEGMDQFQLENSESMQSNSVSSSAKLNRKLRDDVDEKSKSLFDTMPHQGAMPITTDTIFESKTQKRGIFTNHQPGFLQSPTGDLRFQIEIERPNPNVFSLQSSYANNRIVQPVIPVVPSNSLAPVSNQYGPPSGSNSVRIAPHSGNIQNPESTPIIYGNQVPNFRNPGAQGRDRAQLHRNPNLQQLDKNYYGQNAHRNTGYDQRLLFPVITGNSPPTSSSRGYGPETGNQNIDITSTTPAPQSPTFIPPPITTASPTSSTTRPPFFGDYDYETLEDVPKRERFRPRTGIYRYNEPSQSYNVPSEEAKSYYNDHRRPSDSYGPPPSPSYGPPTPPPTYGPPARAPVPEPIPPPKPSSTTSISYQTIPIQTVQTQLVTVPQITISSSGVSETETNGNERPQSPGREPTSSGYGISESSIPERRGLASGGIFTDEQIALLLSASRGSRGTSLYENDNFLSLLLEGARDDGIFLGNADSLGITQLGSNRNRFISNQQVLLNSPVALPLNQFRSTGQAGLFQSQIPSGTLAQQVQEHRIRNADLLLSGTRNGPLLTGDAVNAVDDILREQRLRNAVAELRGRLRHEGQRSVRERQNYRSLLVKGALLLGALTLLPAVATPIAAAATGVQTPHFLLPLAGGRKRRSTIEHDNLASLLELCKIELDRHQIERRYLFTEYLNCIGNSTSTTEESLFDSLPLNGALIAETIRSDLLKYIPMHEIVANSECLQREACETMVEIRKLSNSLSILSSGFINEIQVNPLIKDIISAAERETCSIFHCYKQHNKN